MQPFLRPQIGLVKYHLQPSKYLTVFQEVSRINSSKPKAERRRLHASMPPHYQIFSSKARTHEDMMWSKSNATQQPIYVFFNQANAKPCQACVHAIMES